MRTAFIVLAILVGAAVISLAVMNQPSGFDRCVSIISVEIERNASPGSTLDPRDVEAEAARVCAGATTL
jgi:hypothetical protein